MHAEESMGELPFNKLVWCLAMLWSMESTSSSCTAQWRPAAYGKEKDLANIRRRWETAGNRDSWRGGQGGDEKR